MATKTIKKQPLAVVAKIEIPKDLRELIGTKVSRVQYMDYKPAHFITNIVNPLVRWGDKPYVQCHFCRRLVTGRGLAKHEKACEFNPKSEKAKASRAAPPPKKTATILKLVPKGK